MKSLPKISKNTLNKMEKQKVNSPLLKDLTPKKIDFKGYERDILIYAFRYTLGRRTYSVSTLVEVLEHNWDTLSDSDKALYIREIKQAKEMDMLGMDCDKSEWEKILRLESK